MYSFTICLLILVVGYFVYGRYVERVFGPEAKRPTPALTKADGVDYNGLGNGNGNPGFPFPGNNSFQTPDSHQSCSLILQKSCQFLILENVPR